MRIPAKSSEAKVAYKLVQELQAYFVDRLNTISDTIGEKQACKAVEWQRDEGKHGGGMRYETRDTTLFNSGSVNISQVHYDDMATKSLSSATAISTIIHPQNPHAPSMHMHISWTQMRDGKGYWRIMADLNPSIKDDLAKGTFDQVFKQRAGQYAQEGMAQGEKYFNIPVLNRTRGVSHFYLEDFNSGDFEADKAFALNMGKDVINAYIEIIGKAYAEHIHYTSQEKEIQLAYHTLYFFQVLTLDRGTTSGLLVHDENDVGILGSIPSHINRELLSSWVGLMPTPQDKLLGLLLDVLPDDMPTPVNIETKNRLADAVRKHYSIYPEALSMQASGYSVPPTVNNHKAMDV